MEAVDVERIYLIARRNARAHLYRDRNRVREVDVDQALCTLSRFLPQEVAAHHVKVMAERTDGRRLANL